MRAVFARDLRLAFAGGGGAATGLIFFLAVIATIPFGIGPDLDLLSRIGPAILWIGALLSALLTLDRLFQADREDGTLDLLQMGATPMPLVVLAKCAALWTASSLPLVLAAPRARPSSRARARGRRRGGADASRRHARHRLHRRGRGGGGGRPAARRAARVRARPAAGDPGADLRRLGELRRAERSRSLPAAADDPRAR